MKVAAYQAPLLPCGSMAAIELIRQQIEICEAQGVAILCCPEAILGGLADYAPGPVDFAMDAGKGQLVDLLAPFASETVTSIVGFTELAGSKLYNSAAVFQDGEVIGLYRKFHPAINKSVYEAGDRSHLYVAGDLIFGILICNDSNFFEPARTMVANGAAVLFVPTNNGMPENRGGEELVSRTRSCDVASATEHHVSIVRADVAGRCGEFISYGSSRIVNSSGMVLQSAPLLSEALLIAEIDAGGVHSELHREASRNA